MNYFIAKDSSDENVVGTDYPQAYKFIKGYNPRAPQALFSLYEYRNRFPEYIPDLDGIMLSGFAKLTDIVSHGFAHFIISEKAKFVLEQFKLCPHRFYPLGLYKRKIKHNYFLLFTISDYSDFVNYARSTFIECSLSNGEKAGYVSVTSKEDLLKKRELIKEQRDNVAWTIWGDRIVLSSDFDRELDFFRISRIDSATYISERLKNAMESNGLTGWDFFPALNLSVDCGVK